MQNLHAGVSVVGARGRPWRVERIETFGRPRGARLLHLSRPLAGGSDALAALRPHEPVAGIAAQAGLVPMPARDAAAVVAQAARAARAAFTLQAAARLRGDIHAWQLAPALALARGHSRVLVADEAGMGKTVAAALAVAECLDAASDRRCLVLAPAHLLAQWGQELRERLGIQAAAIDAAALQRLQQQIPAGVTPWSLPGCLLASMDFLKQPHIARSLETVTWDLLVIDEAHMACGASERHAAADMIARRARQVLLLTATPSDGGSERLRALLSIGAGPDAAPPVWLRHAAAGRPRTERRLLVTPAPAVRALHDALAAYARWIAAAPRGGAAVALLCSVLVKRALSSTHALHLSLVRRRALLGHAPAAVQASLFEPDEDAGVIGAATGLPVDRERRRLDALIDMAAAGATQDRRLHALTRLVRRAREPVVIFTCFRDTAALVAASLAPDAAVRLLHGTLPQASAGAALRAFTSGEAGVLVATDVAAQGLNLHQRCRWVIHYDLPWRPPTVAQRTGRVDRLGQTRRVHATFLLDRHALASDFGARLAALSARMQDDDREGARRWDRLAAAEARRLHAVRGACGGPPPPLLREGSITVLEIDAVDAAGASLDRQVVPLNAAEPDARRSALEAAARRQARLGRALASRAARRIAREHAVRDAALSTIQPALRQDGLFERRADRDRAADRAARGRVLAAARDATARDAAQSRVAAVRLRVVARFTMGRPARR
jgi:superfamily II DNA or RNA helicase